MKKDLKKQIKAAFRLIAAGYKSGDCASRYGGWYYRLDDRRYIDRRGWKVIRAAARQAVKAFKKNANGTFRRCAAVRVAARQAVIDAIESAVNRGVCAFVDSWDSE